MFSFTETDCGNPSLMCHILGLVMEHAHGAKGYSYGDGVRAYRDSIGIPIMHEKGSFPKDLIDIMYARYQDDAHIANMRKKVEEGFARKFYDIEPQQLIAMVYSPFTEGGRNLMRYLRYLKDAPDATPADKAAARTLWSAREDIPPMLQKNPGMNGHLQDVVRILSEKTGLTLQDMRRLYDTDLEIDNFDPSHRRNGPGSPLPILPNLNDKLKEKVYSLDVCARNSAGEETKISWNGR